MSLIPVLLVYPNDVYDSRVTKAIEICKELGKYDIHVIKNEEELEKLSTFSYSPSICLLILPNHKPNLIQKTYPFLPSLKWVLALGTGIDRILEFEPFRADEKVKIKQKDGVGFGDFFHL